MSRKRKKSKTIRRWFKEMKEKEKVETTLESKKEEIWDSGLKFVERITIKIPDEILKVCNSIQKQVEDNEFSILCKGKFNDRGEFELGNEYIIPKQEVGGASVDYKDEDIQKYKQDGFNVVIHSHPFESSSFSSADDDFINSNFVCSVLFSLTKFTKAILNIELSNDLKLRVDCDIEVEYSNGVAIDIGNIKIKKYEYTISQPIRRFKINQIENEVMDKTFDEDWKEYFERQADGYN